MTQVNDRSTESDETFQREVLERFDADVPPAGPSLLECETCLSPGTWMIDGHLVVRRSSGRLWAIYGPCDEFGAAKTLDAARQMIRSGQVPQ